MFRQIIKSWNLLKQNEIYICLDSPVPQIFTQIQRKGSQILKQQQKAIIFTIKQYLYIGSIKKFKPEGKGILFSIVHTDLNISLRKYQGNFVNGVGQDEQATFTLYNQISYKNNQSSKCVVFKNATFSKGIVQKCDIHFQNQVYKVQIKKITIKDGVQIINAKVIFPDKKTQYIGDLVRTNQLFYKLQGKGQLIYPNRNHYIGDFKNNKFQGIGQFFFTNGKKYHGSYKNGLRHGQGKFYINSKNHPNNYLQVNWQNGYPVGQAISYPQKIKLKFQKQRQSTVAV